MTNAPQANILAFTRKRIYCGALVSDGTRVCDACFEDVLGNGKQDGDAA